MATQTGSNNNICCSDSTCSSINGSNNTDLSTVSAAPLAVLQTLNTVTLKPLNECNSLATLASLQAFKQDITHRQSASPTQLCANNQHNTAATSTTQLKGHSNITGNDYEQDGKYSDINTSQVVSNSRRCVQDIVTFKPLFKSQPKWIGLSRSITVGSVPTAGMKSLTLERSRDIHLSHQSVAEEMESASSKSSSNPTMIRIRPRVPSGLRFSASPVRRHSDDIKVDDIAGALSSLKSTDWRKYSRKSRSGTSPVGSTASSTLSPECHTPHSESSTPKVGRAPSFRTVRTHLERLVTDGINVDSKDNSNKYDFFTHRKTPFDEGDVKTLDITFGLDNVDKLDKTKYVRSDNDKNKDDPLDTFKDESVDDSSDSKVSERNSKGVEDANQIEFINGLGFSILPSLSFTDDGEGDSDNKYSSQLSDDFLTTPDISDAEYLVNQRYDDEYDVNIDTKPTQLLSYENNKLEGDMPSTIVTVEPKAFVYKNVIVKNPSSSSIENYPVGLNPFESDEEEEDTDEVENNDNEILCSSLNSVPKLSLQKQKEQHSPIPLVKVQHLHRQNHQGSFNDNTSHHTACDSPDGDDISLASSTKLKNLSSFDSNKDSEDELSLHVTEDGSSSPLSLKRVGNDSSVETEDEGLGAVDIEDNEVDKPVTTTRNKNSSKSTTKSKAVQQAMSNIALSVKRMPPSPLALESPNPGSNADDSKNEESRLANGRFHTHPPVKDHVSSENWSVDSNGLGSLRESGKIIPEMSESQVSSASSFDSHLCPSESSLDTTSSTPQDLDKNKNAASNSSPGAKHKYKPVLNTAETVIKTSDVVKNSSQQKLIDFHKSKSLHSSESKKTLSGSNSNNTLSPLLAEHSGGDHVSTSKLRSRSRSPRPDAKQSTASSDSSSEDEGQAAITVKRPSKKRQRGGSSDRWETKERIAEKIPKTVVTSLASSLTSFSSTGPKVIKSVKIPSLPASLPTTPLTSPDSTLTRTKSALTTDSFSKRFPSLSRSHSSASVLQQQKPSKTRPKLGESLRNTDSTKNWGIRPSGSSSSIGYGSGIGSRSSERLYSGSFSPSLETIHSSTLSLFDGPDKDKKKRDLIVEEFYSTEEQYVEALKVLVERYLIPLKSHRILDSTAVDEIFYKINEIYMHHATFLAFLGRSLANWNKETTIGDVIYKTFCKQSVVESYVSFIENFPRAEKVLDEVSSKSSFQKFVEQVEREGRIKLPLKAQIVKPAQRIPRYELLIKRLQEHTPVDHADSQHLKEAEKALHELALRINSVKQSKKEEDLQETVKKLELLLLTDLAVPDRCYIRHDTVQVLNRKDQSCIWLFTDLLVVSTVKRKSGPVSRKASILLQSSSGHDFVENIKQRMWLKLSIEDVEIVQGNPDNQEKIPSVDKEELEYDYKLLGDISELSHKLKCNHNQLDQALRELVGVVNNQLSEYQLKSPPPEANTVDLAATVNNGVVLNLTVVFPSPDKKISWVALVKETKQKLSKFQGSKPPKFIQAVPITKTRAGMQFSCAAPIDGLNSRGFRDIWVCNSDGYVGHMCLLTLMPEPIVTLNTPVPGCNARILCICAVPAFQGYRSRNSSARRRQGITEAPIIKIQQQLQQHDSTDFSGSGEDGCISDSSTTSTDTDDVEMTDDSVPLNIVNRTDSDRSDRTRSSRSASPSSNSVLSSSSGVQKQQQQPIPRDNPFTDPYKSTMWLGTEDGCIHSFLSTDNIKTTKTRIKLQQSSGVLCVVDMDNCVFVSLANGDLIVYKRDLDGLWNTTDYDTVKLTSASSPINKMLPVNGKLWCASHNDIIVVNPCSLEAELTFTGNPDSKRGIHTMVCSGQGVWVAGNGSSKVLLFHATHYGLLLDVSIAQAVINKLHNSDDIIRQHKTACLRITTLVTCKDVLWVGTSAGVILTIPMPKLSSMTTRSTLSTPNVTGLTYGHTGHVRFLTCVESPTGNKAPIIQQPSGATPTLKQKAQFNLHHQQRRKNSINIRTFSSTYLIISGGDGYEDFNAASGVNSDITGKDDSTNHLLLWRV